MPRLGKAKVLTDAEFDCVIRCAAQEQHAERNTAMLYLSFGKGLRVKELSMLNIGHVLDGKRELRQVVTLSSDMTKEGREREFYLVNPAVRVALQTYLDYRCHDPRRGVTRDQALFLSNKGNRFTPNSLQQVFHRRYAQAGIKGASSHSGRRTFATKLVTQHSADIRDIAYLLGHLVQFHRS